MELRLIIKCAIQRSDLNVHRDLRAGFTDKHLTPKILPQPPTQLIQTVQLSPASSILNFPPIHVGDEIVTISFPTYITGIVQSVTMATPVNPGYVHVVTVVDPSYKPFAVLLSYNIIVGQPAQTVNVSSSQRFVAYLDSATLMPKLESYRYEYMVLVYYTPSPISLEGATPQDMLLGSSCSDATCLFSNSPISSKLAGQPVAGTVFYRPMDSRIQMWTLYASTAFHLGDGH
uniref:Uncharacterized protein n=1 Tax=Caenorhabditis japonica TaxID=281687 RepID=A0A8R1HNT1_CAEJA